jgi:Uma2 family endonuclease
MTFDKLHEEQGLTLDDFLRDFNQAPFELINGERLPWMPGLSRHTVKIEAIKDALKDYLRDNPIGRVYAEATYIVTYRKQWVKGSLTPDLLFFDETRLDQYIADNPDWEDQPYALVPDIAIEVVSKNDSYSGISRKVFTYLQDGVKAVWVIDPQSETALVHTPSKTAILGKNDSISDDALLPGFELALSAVFKRKK